MAYDVNVVATRPTFHHFHGSMAKAIARDPIYRHRRFQSETIELCVRWYLTYRLSSTIYGSQRIGCPAFFTKVLKTHQPQRPRKVYLDGNAATHRRCDCYGKRIPSGGPSRYAVAGS
jgi:hypothetical protein